MAKAAGYLALSGIAVSIIKSINTFQKPRPIIKKPSAELPMEKTVGVVKEDTVLSLSRKYGVSMEAIREASELIGDTIYPGKKFARSSKGNESC